MSHIGSSSDIEELSFAAARPLINESPCERRSVGRSPSTLINQLWGAVTFSPSVAASALFSQGQSNYPGPAGTSPSAQTTTTTAGSATAHNGLADCLACALDVLTQSGFVRTPTGWTTSDRNAAGPAMAVGPSDLDHTVATT